MRKAIRVQCLCVGALLLVGLFAPLACYATNAVLGEIHFEGKSNIERTSGVWVDGEYVGYLKELTGSKKVMLLPGKHEIVIRQDGYKDFMDEVTLQPGEVQVVTVAMEKASTTPQSLVTSTVKIAANPSRAAVFIDGQFIGHVGEFRGWGRALLVDPGLHRIRIALPGYESFETDINPQPNQKVEIKTDLVKSNAPVADPLLGQGGGNIAPSPAANAIPSAVAVPTTR